MLKTKLVDHAEGVTQTDSVVVVWFRFRFWGLVYWFEEVEGPLGGGARGGIVVCMWGDQIPDSSKEVV